MKLVPFLFAFIIVLGSAFAEEPRAFRLLRLPNLDHGDLVKWGPGPLGTPSEITYAFVTRSTNLSNMIGDCAELEPLGPLIAKNGISREEFLRSAAEGLGLWERAAGVHFRHVTDETKADLLIGAARRNLPITYARVSLRLGNSLAEGVTALTQASICLDDDVRWSLAPGHAPGPVLSTRMIIAHEAGHALGLDHPRDKNVVMARSVESNLTELAAGDQEGAQALYGKP